MATARKTTNAKTTAPKSASTRKAPGAPDSPMTTMSDEEGDRAAGSPSHDDIARRAYEIYLERGGEHGRDEDDWRQAEEELRHGR